MDSLRFIVLNFTVFDQRGIPSVLRALMEEAFVTQTTEQAPISKGVKLSATGGYRDTSRLMHTIADLGFRLSSVRVLVKEHRFQVRCKFAKDGDMAPRGYVAAVTGMCTSSLWKVQAYRNPALMKGEVVPGTSDIEFALGAPKRPNHESAPVLALDTSFL